MATPRQVEDVILRLQKICPLDKLALHFHDTRGTALANTLIQVTAPDEVRGRVMGLYTMVFQAFMRVGALQAGLMSDWLSAPVSLGLGAVLSLAYGLWIALFKPAVRRL